MRPLVLLIPLLLVPATSASWTAGGNREPDTPMDRTSGQMFVDADVDPNPHVRRLYFTAVALYASQIGGGVSPNSGAIGSRLAPPGFLTFEAYLGVWKDCNLDGYVGAADALMEYPAVALPSSHPCPPDSEGAHAHNDGERVNEFLWVGPSELDAAPTLVDGAALVWGDFGLPGHAHRDCVQVPLPRGTTGSSGGLLAYVDCQIGHQVGHALAADGPAGDLGFEDPEHPETSCRSPLNQGIPVYGDPHRCETGGRPGILEPSERSAATVWTCGEDADELALRDPTASSGRGALSEVSTGQTDPIPLTDPQGNYLVRPMPSPQLHDPEGSFYDAAVTSERALLSGCEEEARYLPFYLTPAAFEASAGHPSAKRQADFPMLFGEGVTREVPIEVQEENASAVHRQARAARAVGAATGYGWWSPYVYPPPGYWGGTLRSDLQPSGPLWFTFYASVGLGVLAFADAPGLPATYGAEACLLGDPLRDGWDCDPSHWWNPEYGAPAMRGGPVPGTMYWLRDVDCMDGRVSGAVPVGASLAALSSEGGCP